MSTIEERVAALESALASMTATEKRIVELPAASSVANDDFVALDGVANGSRRFAASNLGGKAEVMTEDEWDDLPDSKLTDGKVYALSGVSPSTQDNPLWQKLGFAALDTTADDCSGAINELNTGLTTLNSNLTTLNSNLTAAIASSIFGVDGEHWNTGQTSIDTLVNNIVTAGKYFSFDNTATVSTPSTGANRQFGFGWTNTTKKYAWVILFSFSKCFIGKRNNANTFTWTEL